MEAAVTDQLVALARLWGAVRWFHPWVATGRVDWDAATREAVHVVLDGSLAADDFRKVVATLADSLGDPATRLYESDEQPGLNRPAARPGSLVQFRDDSIGRVAVVTCAAFDGPDIRPLESMLAALEEIAAANVAGVVIDLRDTAWRGGEDARRVLRRLIANDVALPARRSRQWVGWPSDVFPTSGDYHSAFVVRDPTVLEGLGEALVEVPVVLIAGPSIDNIDAAVGLHAAGRAHLVWAGVLEDDTECELIDLAPRLQVTIRRTELLRVDGSVGAAPDVTLDQAEADRAVNVAVGLLGSPVAGRGDDAAVVVRQPGTASSDDIAEELPAVEHRVLGAFKWWNVISYHFPYRDLLDEPWDGALARALPEIVGAEDATAYHLAMARFVVAIQDTHAGCQSAVLNRWRGVCSPALDVRTIEGSPVIIAVGEGVEGVQVGDVVATVDGEPASSRSARLAPYAGASTPQAQRYRLDAWMLQGDPDSNAHLELDGIDGSRRAVDVPRVAGRGPESDGPQWRVLPEGPGYIDLTRLAPGAVDEALDAIWDAPAIIFDIRGYPNGTAWLIAPRLTDERVIAARFWKPIARNASPDHRTREEFVQRIPDPVGPTYRGRVAVLIDERCISQAEHTCLFFEAATRGEILFVGSTTNGANGDVTSVSLPGGITAVFSGHDVRHADGRQLQRVGIQPDIHVEPTIAGIRAGRDEVLEAAVAALR